MPGFLSGMVVDGDWMPISGASVSITGGNLPSPRNIGTDPMGNYYSGDLPAGTYTITASKDSVQNSVTATVTAGTNTTAQTIQLFITKTGTTPTITINSPLHNASVTAPVTLSCSVSNTNAVDLFINGMWQTTEALTAGQATYQTTLSLTGYAGWITIKVEAINYSSGMRGSAEVMVNLGAAQGGSLPTVEVTSPPYLTSPEATVEATAPTASQTLTVGYNISNATRVEIAAIAYGYYNYLYSENFTTPVLGTGSKSTTLYLGMYAGKTIQLRFRVENSYGSNFKEVWIKVPQ
jgi:hypothetical protein